MNQHNRTAAEAVLAFWFGPLADGFAAATTRRRWFAADVDFDREVERRFAATLDSAARGALAAWLDEPRGRLAFIIVTDQFSRQIHRGSAHAFATDTLALEAARTGVALGHDRALALDERAFFYLPFEHSESLEDQDRSVDLFTALFDATPPAQRALTAETLRFARSHRDIMQSFGRFPHRNAALGRTSTAAELEFLRSASRFGQ